MGRQRQTEPPVDVEHIREHYSIRQDGVITRRDCHVPALSGEPATFRGPGNQLLVRVYVNGKIRRLSATRIAWAVHTGAWPPKGSVVRCRNGVDDDLRAENLILTPANRDPFGSITSKHSEGGRASSLQERQARDVVLLIALAANGGETLPQLSRLVGSSESCVCIRLERLAEHGLTCSPKCQAHVRWQLSQAGRELVATGRPVIIDDTDRDILTMIASAPMRQLELARRVGVASLTIKRRITRLIDAGMAAIDRERRFRISGVGVTALGGASPPKPPAPWVKVSGISAASAKDVQERVEHRPNDDRSAAQRSQQGRESAAKAVATMRMNRTVFNKLAMTG
jgi:hypothetical protein